MFDFIWIWMWLLLPLPLLVFFSIKPAAQKGAIMLPRLPQHIGQRHNVNRFYVLLMVIGWTALIAASARPVWYGDPISIMPEHRDMMLAVDLSGSMEIQDMQQENGKSINRLTAIKEVLSTFITQRQGDRLGLILFADHAYLQTPLTLDTKTVNEQLNRAVLGLVGQNTAIGEAIAVATKTFIDSKAKQRVLVLLSDGQNTAGVLEPMEAAKLAKEHNVMIYTVGVGAKEVSQRGWFGSRTVNPSQDLDEKTLTDVATLTGGAYFRATDPRQLAQIYQQINKLEPISDVVQTWRPHDELFRYPLTLTLLVSALLVLLRRRYG
ncbi:MAG: vWA domain-containing protein [Enterovibrio sp.]